MTSLQHLPGQDVITVDLSHYTRGPLPTQELETIAEKLFIRQYPRASWTDPSFTSERTDCRRFALQLRCDFLKLDGWTLENAGREIEANERELSAEDARL